MSNKLFQSGYADFYASYNQKQLDKFEQFSMPWIVHCLPRNTNARILDVGCGPGLLLGYLLRLGYGRTEGIDVSADQIRAAQSHYLKHYVKQADLFEYLALQKNYWDCIILSDVIEHIPKQQLLQLPALLKDALVADGIAIIRTANADSPIASRARYIDLTHELSFTDYSLRQLMAQCGFVGEVVSQHIGKPIWKRGVFRVRNVLWRLIYRLYESETPGCCDAALAMKFWQKNHNEVQNPNNPVI